MTMVSNLWVQANGCNGSLPCSLSMDQQECAVMDPPEPPRARTAAVWQSPGRGPGTCQNTEPRRNCSDWIWEVRSHFNRKWARCHAIICDPGICANLNVDLQSTIVNECIFQSVHFVKQLRKGCRPVSVLPATKPTPGDRLAGHKSCQISWNHSWLNPEYALPYFDRIELPQFWAQNLTSLVQVLLHCWPDFIIGLCAGTAVLRQCCTR